MTSTSFSIVEQQNRLVVTNGRTELHLARSNGCILSIRDAGTGETLCSVEDCTEHARLFRLVAMRRLQRGRAGDANVHREVEWERRADGLSLRYPHLTFENEPAECSAEVGIEPGGEDELLLALAVSNDDGDAIHEVQFPMLPGWRNVDGRPPVELTGGAKWRSHVGNLPRYGPPAYCQWYQQTGVDYPGPYMYMPWLDFAVGERGLSLVNYMDRTLTGGVGGVNLAGHERGNLECYWWRHYPLIEPGRTWTSPAVGIRVHDGDWHVTADRYYEWFRAEIGVDIEQPGSLRTAIGFQNIILRNFDGTRANDVSTLGEHARTGRRYGVDHLTVWDQLSIGNYAIYDADVDLFDYAERDREALRAAIAEATGEGAIVSALVNFRHVNVRSELYEQYRSEAALCLDGSEWRENWCGCVRTSAIFTKHLGLNCMLLSPRSPATRDRVDELMGRYMDLGYTAIFYDQPWLYYLDYNHMGDERRPDDASAAVYETVAGVRARLREQSEDAYVIGEQFDIFSASRCIDLHMEWNFTNQGIEDLARTLYACPHALLSYVIDYVTSAETQASHAFAAGLLLCITIDGGEANLAKRPALAEHVARLADLRRRCADRMAFGRFRHTVGLTSDSDPGVVAFAYDSPAGPAVALAADERGGRARVGIDLSRFRTPSGRETGKLMTTTGETADVAAADALDCALGPNEAAVWYC